MTRVRIRHLSTTTTDPNKAGEKMLEAKNEKRYQNDKKSDSIKSSEGIEAEEVWNSSNRKAAKLVFDDEVRD